MLIAGRDYPRGSVTLSSKGVLLYRHFVLGRVKVCNVQFMSPLLTRSCNARSPGCLRFHLPEKDPRKRAVVHRTPTRTETLTASLQVTRKVSENLNCRSRALVIQ